MRQEPWGLQGRLREWLVWKNGTAIFLVFDSVHFGWFKTTLSSLYPPPLPALAFTNHPSSTMVASLQTLSLLQMFMESTFYGCFVLLFTVSSVVLNKRYNLLMTQSQRRPIRMSDTGTGTEASTDPTRAEKKELEFWKTLGTIMIFLTTIVRSFELLKFLIAEIRLCLTMNSIGHSHGRRKCQPQPILSFVVKCPLCDFSLKCWAFSSEMRCWWLCFCPVKVPNTYQPINFSSVGYG
jgi:hypothetical protein